MQHSVTSPNDMPYTQYVQLQQMVPQNDHKISFFHAGIGSLPTVEPCRQLHIQRAYGECQCTSSNMLMPTANDTTPTHKVPTNFVLNPMQPVRLM